MAAVDKGEGKLVSDDQSAESMPQLPLDQDWQLGSFWQPSLGQQAQFQQLYEQVLLGNRQLNLTRITEPAEFWEKHLWDSLRGIVGWLRSDDPAVDLVHEVIDIGTGGGFPGIPIAIARPDWQVTLLDSTRKKVSFLEQIVASLDLTQVEAVCDRAEQVGRDSGHREYYDLALVRAVGSAATCAEYALPLLDIGGYAVLYRGQWADEEAVSLTKAVEQLGGAVEKIDAFTTPLSQSVRHCIYLRKIAPTPAQFPRAVGMPAKQPLG